MSYYEDYELQDHAKSDKVKWIIVFTAIVVLLAGVLATIIPVYSNINKRKVVINVADADMIASVNTNDGYFIVGDIRVKISRGYGSAYPAFYPVDAPAEYRAYAGNIITVSTSRGNIENVEFVTSSHDKALIINAMDIEPGSNEWKYKVGNDGVTSGHAKITQIIVYYSFKGEDRPVEEQSSTNVDPGPEVVDPDAPTGETTEPTEPTTPAAPVYVPTEPAVPLD